MKGKIAFLAGAGAGYVLGARDGRQRYEQIKTQAQQLWEDPKVQEKVSAVTGSRPAPASHASSDTPPEPASRAGKGDAAGEPTS